MGMINMPIVRKHYMSNFRKKAETGHFWWALKVWRWTMQLMDAKDYDPELSSDNSGGFYVLLSLLEVRTTIDV